MRVQIRVANQCHTSILLTASTSSWIVWTEINPVDRACGPLFLLTWTASTVRKPSPSDTHIEAKFTLDNWFLPAQIATMEEVTSQRALQDECQNCKSVKVSSLHTQNHLDFMTSRSCSFDRVLTK
jgi:hypothetical protein